MENFRLRKYERSDLDKIKQMLKTHFDAEYVPKRRILFDWIASHNPAACNYTTYLIIEDKARIIAYLGRMPVDFMVNGKRESAFFTHDLLVHPEYRKGGQGVFLTNRLSAAIEEMTNTFFGMLWMSHLNYLIHKRRGYHELKTYSFVKFLNSSLLLKKIIKNRLLLRLLPPLVQELFFLVDFVISKLMYSDMISSQIKKFDRRFDTLADEISKKFTLIVLRHSDYLNWKYVDKPFANYTIFAAERNNKLTGYIVLQIKKDGEEGTNGIIVDILSDPNDSQSIAFLCQIAINFFKKEEVNVINCYLTDKRFIRVFKKFLFFKRRWTIPVLIANRTKHCFQNLITELNSWFLTYGDSDGFMWDRNNV